MSESVRGPGGAAGPAETASETASETRRLDKWLWYARFFRTRSLATRFCATGRLRVNSETVAKAHAQIRAGDVLTFPKGRAIRVVRVVALGTRRGPATEARTLYEDLAPPEDKSKPRDPADPQAPARRQPGRGRPTKRERRETDRLRGGD